MAKKSAAVKNATKAVAATATTKNAAQAPAPSSPPAGEAVEKSVTRFQQFNIRRIHRSEINRAAYNPRIMDKPAAKRLKKALQDHGLVEPLVVNVRDNSNVLVGGHQRLTQLDVLEGSQDYYLDVSTVDVSADQEKQLNVVLNNYLLQGSFDFGLLEELIGEPGFEVTKTGFDRASLATMLDEGVLDGIFGAEAAEQAAAEQPVIAELESIKESGREAEKTERGGSPNSGIDGAGIASPAGTLSPATAAPGQSSSSPPAVDEFSPAAELQRKRDQRRQYIAKSQDANASEFFIVLVADSEGEVDAFLRAMDLPLGNRYVDMNVVTELMGLDLSAANNPLV